jgi:EmrB/QacA subfamily drug resistance transporter
VTSAPASRRELIVAFSGMMVATLLAALDQTIVTTALPRIVGDLGGFERLSWVVSAYLIASTVTIPLYGKLSDLYGRRMLMAVSISIFVVGSVLCGAAQTMDQLIAARALQGLGAGGLIPLSQAAIADLFPPRERGRYLGFIAAVWATAAMAGPILGGTLTDHASWRWIFFINLPLGGLALLVVLRNMRVASVRREHRIDWLGAAVLSAGATAVLLALAWGGTTFPWGSVEVLATAAAGVLLLVAFVRIERRVPEPLIPLSIFRGRVIAVTTAGSFVIGALLFAITVFVPVYVQSVLGVSATTSGVILMPMLLAWAVSAFVCGHVISRTGRYRVFPIVGSLLVAAGIVVVAAGGDVDSSRATIAVAVGVVGAGMGLSLQPYLIAGQNAAHGGDIGVVTSGMQFARSMGGSLAVAGLGALLANRVTAELAERLGPAAARVDIDRLLQGGALVPQELLGDTRNAVADAISLVFLGAAALALAGIALAFALEERPLHGEGA